MGGFNGYHNPELQTGDQGPSDVERFARVRQLMQQQAMMPGQLQAQQQSLQAGAMENQQKQIQLKDQQAMTDAMHEWDGKDINQLPGLMLKHGASAQTVMSTKTGIIKQQQDLANLSKDQLANEKVKNDYFAQQIENVKSLPPEQQPQAFEAAKADAIQKGHLDPQSAQAMQYQGPQQLDLMEKSLLGHSQALETALKGAQTTEAANRGAQSAANTTKIKAEMAFYQKQGLAPGVPLDAQEAADWISKNPGKGPADFMKMKAGLTAQENAKAQAGMLTDAAKQMAAQNYATTGQLPAGMRSPGMSAGILNQAASGPNGIPNIAANKANYKADSGSLASLQKNFDQVTAFENTAGKNLDVFLNQAQKVVDSGNPMINRPLRSVIGSMGGADQAAFDAARTTALTEISKVLNSSNASGVLSDSARHEVEGLIKPNATLKQIVSAANILKQDMANRHQAYQDQINTIKGRQGGGSPQQSQYTAPAGAPTATGKNGHKIVYDNGKWVDAASGQPIQ